MSFNSIDFLLFLPIVTLLYYAMPQKLRSYWLLLCSYYFYMSWNAKFGLLILFTTLVTYFCALLLDWVNGVGHHQTSTGPNSNSSTLKKLILSAGLLINLSLLGYFKYTNFFLQNLGAILQKAGITLTDRRLDIILPVGISFFIFQALGYLIDVYRQELPAEKNIFRYALFVSFFPQLVAGPIERSKNLLRQLKQNTEFNVLQIKNGLLTLAYGLFLKMVVADNLTIFIDGYYASPQEADGMQLLFATLLFAFQIYCDFNGYTLMAIGSARILGYELNANFDTPYLASSIRDFWKRWHISLTSWFRDYLYIPLGGNRVGKIRKYRNTLIVFLCSGLWHGASWNYVVWGGINGLFCVLEEILSPGCRKLFQRIHIDTGRRSYKVLSCIFTFLLVDFTWLFFRAEGCKSALLILKKIVTEFRLGWFLNLEFGNLKGSYSILAALIGLLVCFVMDVLKYKHIDVKALIFRQQMVYRWAIYLLLFLALIYLGNYGGGYEQTQFIYFQF